MAELVPGARRALGEMLAVARRPAGRRRGLNADDVAERAGVGKTWYRWLEEGRNIGLSPIALGWVADALTFRDVARRRLFELAGIDETNELPAMVEPVRPSVRELIEGSGPYPAYVYGRRGDILAWNDATEAVYRCHLVPPPRRNTYLFLFTQPEVRKLIVNWQDQASRLVLELRTTMARAPQDAALAQLRRLLEAESPDFRALWRAKLTPAPPPVKVFLHPRVGRLVFDVESLTLDGEPGMRARFYLPRSRDGTRGRIAQLLARHRRDTGNGRHRALRETVRKVKDHIDACYAREIPLDELAELAGIDKYRLLRAFGSEVGFPPHAYQMLVRVFHARRLLSRGDSAAQVALAVGFTDQSHLIRQFRRVEGMTPAAYLRRQA
jgi:AraC-like DNA-binding protein/transcriptional regulator with XRE-family HTH domain